MVETRPYAFAGLNIPAVLASSTGPAHLGSHSISTMSIPFCHIHGEEWLTLERQTEAAGSLRQNILGLSCKSPERDTLEFEVTDHPWLQRSLTGTSYNL
jgi:hypothetical protein